MSRHVIVVVQSPLLYRVVGRNGEATFPRGTTIRSPQSSGIFIFLFLFNRPLAGRSWTAALFLIYYDRTLLRSPPLSRLLILLLLLISGNVHPKPGPAPVHPTTSKFPCSILVVVVVLPDSFRGMGPCRNSTETQQTDHVPRFGPEVKNGSSAKDSMPERLRCGTIQEMVSQIL